MPFRQEYINHFIILVARYPKLMLLTVNLYKTSSPKMVSP